MGHGNMRGLRQRLERQRGGTAAGWGQRSTRAARKRTRSPDHRLTLESAAGGEAGEEGEPEQVRREHRSKASLLAMLS